MKTALESYLETVTVQEKIKILTEQEMQQLKSSSNIDTILEHIQNSINASIREGKFKSTIRMVEERFYTKYNGAIRVWHLLGNVDKYSNYNRKADAFYSISRISPALIDFMTIIKALEKLGYNCSVKDTMLKEAMTKTGMSCLDYRVKEITINWENNLTILGGNMNG